MKILWTPDIGHSTSLLTKFNRIILVKYSMIYCHAFVSCNHFCMYHFCFPIMAIRLSDVTRNTDRLALGKTGKKQNKTNNTQWAQCIFQRNGIYIWYFICLGRCILNKTHCEIFGPFHWIHSKWPAWISNKQNKDNTRGNLSTFEILHRTTFPMNIQCVRVIYEMVFICASCLWLACFD